MRIKPRWILMLLGLPALAACALPGGSANRCAGPIPANVAASHGAGGTVAMTWPSSCNDFPVSYRAQPR